MSPSHYLNVPVAQSGHMSSVDGSVNTFVCFFLLTLAFPGCQCVCASPRNETFLLCFCLCIVKCYRYIIFCVCDSFTASVCLLFCLCYSVYLDYLFPSGFCEALCNCVLKNGT